MHEISRLSQQEINAVSGGVTWCGTLVVSVASAAYGLLCSYLIIISSKDSQIENIGESCRVTTTVTGLSVLSGLYFYVMPEVVSEFVLVDTIQVFQNNTLIS